MSIGYRPRGMSMWDPWYIQHQGAVHMFYLQRLAKGSDRPQPEEDWLGHASSPDLIHWTEHALALPPGEPGALDDLQPWTGCVVEHAGRFYHFYTMRAKADLGFGASQRIGLALSDDLEHWERYSGNPVIVPDSRWYYSHDHPLPRGASDHQVDCRDLLVVRDPSGDGWYGFFAARIPAEELSETSVVAVAHSRDLLHWEQLPPAFTPRKYACVEMHDVFPLDGRWYMTCLTGTFYGNRGLYSDPNCIRGTIYAVADQPQGPYHEIEGDNVLLAGDASSIYSCRSLMFEGQRHMMCAEPSLVGLDTLSPPMVLKTTSDGRLRATYSPRTQAWRKATLIAPQSAPPIAKQPYSAWHWQYPAGRWRQDGQRYVGESRTGWQLADMGVGAGDVEMEARITLRQGAAAGFAYRVNTALDWSVKDIVFALDAEEQVLFSACVPLYDNVHRRQFPVRLGQTYHVRVRIRRPRFEVYVDDVLVLQFAMTIDDPVAPSVALYVDRGQVEITDLAVYALGE